MPWNLVQSGDANFMGDGRFWDRRQLRKALMMKRQFTLHLE